MSQFLLTERQGYTIAQETGTRYEPPITDYGETTHLFQTDRMTIRSEWIAHSFDLVASVEECLAAKVRAMRARVFEDVYSGIHHPSLCPEEGCPCRDLKDPLPDAADEEVARLRMTERGLTLEEARASLLM